MNTDNAYLPGEAIAAHPIVDHPTWLEARLALMAQEKELTRMHDRVAAARRALPWEKVTKRYEFDTPDGIVELGGLFQGKRQLIVYHFMFAPGWEAGCPGCSHMGDHIDGPRLHFGQADTAFAAVSRAPLADLLAYRKRMGWKFPWVSSGRSDFNRDYKVSFTPEQVEQRVKDYNFGTLEVDYDELPGLSVFYRDESGSIFHTYSAFARGLDVLVGTYQFLDLTPKGRCEPGGPEKSWLRRHDEYADGARPEKCCG